MGLCREPKYLSFLSLPDAVREQVKKSLIEAKIIISQNTVGDEEGWPIEKIIDTMEQTQFDPAEYKKFLDYIRWYENGKNIPNLKEISPSLFINKYQ